METWPKDVFGLGRLSLVIEYKEEDVQQRKRRAWRAGRLTLDGDVRESGVTKREEREDRGLRQTRRQQCQSTDTGGATENKEDKNLYKQVIRLLKN
jgi:hypothetical protein